MFVTSVVCLLQVCESCDPVVLDQYKKSEATAKKESLDLKRRKELNRIKAKYGLRVN